ncbi:tankyrase-2-like, partial [Trichogramma pretiosum]|uniref:tankyrase-2-like n=1 Tax=Trichogramma pretiosum TaxID=7493 RepID=UPI000C71BF3A
GETPLHFICDNSKDDDELATLLFELIDEKHQPLQINARDKWGCTPLHYVTGKKLAELMLRRGADPTSANAHGETPLHNIIARTYDEDLAKLYFEVIDEIGKTVQIDAQNKFGRTLLHIALSCTDDETTEILLERGADPNLADAKGMTPLHFICEHHQDDGELAETFFKINDEKNQLVRFDVPDVYDRTPLQLAVAYIKPKIVDLLLDRGADLSNFFFPTESYFAKNIPHHNSIDLTKRLGLASGALLIVESLEKSGYELDVSEVLTIMKFFAKEGLFVKSVDPNVNLSVENYFVQHMKKTMIKEQMSVYDLIQLRPEEAAKQLTYADYYKFTQTWIES